MWDSCAIDLTVQLPKSVAQQIQEVQQSQPELLSRILTYAMARRSIFDRLVSTASVEAGHGELS